MLNWNNRLHDNILDFMKSCIKRQFFLEKILLQLFERPLGSCLVFCFDDDFLAEILFVVLVYAIIGEVDVWIAEDFFVHWVVFGGKAN